MPMSRIRRCWLCWFAEDEVGGGGGGEGRGERKREERVRVYILWPRSWASAAASSFGPQYEPS